MLAKTIEYHQLTKHHPHRYARSMGYLDWATQPDPFRRFPGAELIPLDQVTISEKPTYDSLFETQAIQPVRLHRTSVSQLFYDSLALSTWKQHLQNRWSLRINPSSGNLHPTEAYLIAGPIEGLSDQPTVAHYCPYEHGLEIRYKLSLAQWQQLQSSLPKSAILIGLTSIHWRESWKYGERAFRYCQHDLGHAIAAVTIAAAAMGWQTRILANIPDEDIACLLGTYRQSGIEAEHPECLLAVYPIDSKNHNDQAYAYQLPDELLNALKKIDPAGKPNTLSGDHHHWPIIDEVSAATQRLRTDTLNPEESDPTIPPTTTEQDRCISARQIIHQRRSAVALDGETSISRNVFYRILQRLIPQNGLFPFEVLGCPPSVHLAIFVHRVDDLASGLYFLVRNQRAAKKLKDEMHKDFLWQKPQECPDELDFYLLMEGDYKQTACAVSCGQEIAADGTFSLGMIAEFESRIQKWGPWFYKRLFWETGLIGQLLYLEAEAAGIRGTGIGCFFDDVMHEILGIKEQNFQSLYHFTIGGPVEDHRLQNIPPYAHLENRP
ncbi:MAG: SagB/ThcOx family dehydrogenase [Planctomycetes bacterium]|nr:SagB/ThcOx family dehydrogenase [Planctomycetota bacterium]